MTMKPDPTESPAAPVSEGGGELVKQLKALHAAHQIRISEITDNGWFPMGDRYIEAMFAALAAAEERAKEAEVSLAAMLENFGGYNTPEVDAAIAHMQSVGLDVWSMQRVMEIQGAERKKIEARATRADSERDEALRALEPFAEIGNGVTFDPDGVWRRRWRGKVTNHGRDPEIIFTDYEPFTRASALLTRISGEKPDADNALTKRAGQ